MEKLLPTRHGQEESVSTQGIKTQVILAEPQRLALEWLMGGGSITEASQYAGVCRQTVSEWLNHDEDFRQVFEQWKQQVISMNQARLLALGENAMEAVAAAIRETRDVKVALVVLKSLGILGAGK